MGFRVAVVGATGNVGREFLTILAERDFPAVEHSPQWKNLSPRLGVAYDRREFSNNEGSSICRILIPN
jgi:aspartate-semialdehyde dehydrogenase